MSSLANKRILLGITGGIAAYKSAELVREYRRRGADVRVVMTPAAQTFITPLTLQALSGNPVHTALLDPVAEAGMGHIELARWAELMVIAPTTADTIARLAAGEAGDLLTTLVLACRSPMVLAPAMNQAMWHHPATQANLDILRKRAVLSVGPAEGEQACGDVGAGRMVEPPAIADFCESLFETGALAGRTVVITAGPTREPIDPVRYISNHSSGKMGYALAQAAYEAGAKVVLISGPVNIAVPEGVECRAVESAQDMHREALNLAPQADVFIGAAAVADYRVAEVATQKMKKQGGELTLTLVQNPDIIADVARSERRPYVVGFAAETEQVLRHARDKLVRKGLDLVIANDVSTSDIGFNSDHNAVTVLGHNVEHELPRQNKNSLARELIAIISASMQ